jgi:VIT1/CCC1 family predicted Fe2+/Mn2+ transporter
VGFGVVLFVAPRVLGYTDRVGASWTSWVVGVIAVVLGAITTVSSGNRIHRQAIQP